MSNLVELGKSYSELSLDEIADLKHESILNDRAVSKVYPDAKSFTFNGTVGYWSNGVNVDNFQGIEFVSRVDEAGPNVAINARLWSTVKRPGKERIRIYSKVLYGFTLKHLLMLANDLSEKKIMKSLGHVFKMQEPKASDIISRPNKIR